eukprot:12914966-Prorocentrum_lima.AAC.1
MFGISKYPIDKWVEAGEPMINTKGWIKLCSKIAAKGPGESRLLARWGFPRWASCYSGVSQVAAGSQARVLKKRASMTSEREHWQREEREE